MGEKEKKLKKFTPGEKVHIHALIDKKVYDDLIAFAPQYYGKRRGSISYVIEEAIKSYIYPRKDMVSNPCASIREVFAQVVSKLREYYGFTPQECFEYELDSAIAEVRGSDPRTVKKWKERFTKFGLIKCIGSFYSGKIYELVGTMGVKVNS